METGAKVAYMNPIALIEATAAARSAVLGALATHPVVPSRTAGTAASRPKWRSASSMLAAVQRLGRLRHVQLGTLRRPGS